MSIKPRKKHILKKIILWIFWITIFVCLIFSINLSSTFSKPRDLLRELIFSKKKVLDLFLLSRAPLFISPVGDSNVNIASIEKLLRESNIAFAKVTLSGMTYLVDILNNGQVRFSSQKDLVSQISSLQRILKQLTIEGKTFKSIDFRFNEPIISF